MLILNVIELIGRTFKFVVGVPGNSIIAYYFFTQCCNRKTSFNMFVSLMAFLDLLVCSLREANVLMRVFYVDKSIANFSCRFMYEIPFIAADASLWILFGLSYDRYRKITKPLKRQLNGTHILATCVVPFFVSFLTYYPYIDSHKIDTTRRCVLYRRIGFIAQIFNGTGYGVLFTLIPVISIVSCYCLTSRFIRRQSVLADDDPQKKLEYERNKTALATMKLLTVVMESTVALPRIILASYYCLNIFYKDLRDAAYFPIIQSAVYSILFANNTINILVYMRHIKAFRDFVIDHVPCFCCSALAKISEKRIIVVASIVNGKSNCSYDDDDDDDDDDSNEDRKPRNGTDASLISVEIPLNEK